MPKQLKIVVLGGGLIGLTSAKWLIKMGADVTVLEIGNQCGLGAGQYNSGMIHPSQASPWLAENTNKLRDQKVYDLAVKSKALLQRLRREIDCKDISRPDGSLQIFDTAGKGYEKYTDYISRGIPVKRFGEIYGRYALEFPDDSSGSAAHFCERLVRELQDSGCKIHTNKDARLEIKGDRCIGVTIGQQKIEADHVIIACGADSADFLSAYGIDIPVIAQKGHALVFERPDCSLPEVPVMHWESRSAMTVFEGELRLSGTVGEKSPRALLDVWERIAPSVTKKLGAPIVEWTATRPASSIGRPIIGPAPIENVWINTGHGHMGWSLCAGSAELMSRLIMGETAPEFSLP